MFRVIKHLRSRKACLMTEKRQQQWQQHGQQYQPARHCSPWPDAPGDDANGPACIAPSVHHRVECVSEFERHVVPTGGTDQTVVTVTVEVPRYRCKQSGPDVNGEK